MWANWLSISVLFGCCLALDMVRYGAFVKGATYSVAQELGFFAAYGLEVVYNQVQNSGDAIESVLNGEYDVLVTTVDNAIHYRLNLNQSITAIGQVDQGRDIVFASVPCITEFNQLEGLPIMVDAPANGYAYLLRKILRVNGLELGRDYYFMIVGGTLTRYSYLVHGLLDNGTAAYSTILTYPFTVESQVLPEAQRPNILGRVSDYVMPLSSGAFLVRQSISDDPSKRSLLARFIAAMHAANVFLLDPRNANCSVRAIADTLGVDEAVASLQYASAIDQPTGEVSTGGNFTISQEGILNNIAVRKEFDGFQGLPDDFDFDTALIPGTGKLIDYSIRDAGLALYNNSQSNGSYTAGACTMSWDE